MAFHKYEAFYLLVASHFLKTDLRDLTLNPFCTRFSTDLASNPASVKILLTSSEDLVTSKMS